jgi:hypothetical protein
LSVPPETMSRPCFDERVGQNLGVLHDLGGVVLELRLQRFTEGHGLGGDHMHQRAALEAREDGRVELLGQVLVVGEDHAATRTAQRLVGGGRRDMRNAAPATDAAPPATRPAMWAMSTMR